MKPDPRSELERLGALVHETEDPETVRGLAIAIASRALELADEPPPSPWARVVGHLPDVAAIVVFGALALAGATSASTAGGMILAVLAARMYPRRFPFPSSRGPGDGKGGGSSPPSGLATLAAGFGALAPFVGRHS